MDIFKIIKGKGNKQMTIKCTWWFIRRYWIKETENDWEWAHDDREYLNEYKAKEIFNIHEPNKDYPVRRLYKVVQTVVDGRPLDEVWTVMGEKTLWEGKDAER